MYEISDSVASPPKLEEPPVHEEESGEVFNDALEHDLDYEVSSDEGEEEVSRNNV